MISYEKIIVAILLLLPLLGIAIEVLHARIKLRGYGHIAHHIRAIAKALNGETTREGDDLFIRGKIGTSPLEIRFSYSEYSPGLIIEMPVERELSLFCIPRRQESTKGQTLNPTGQDPRFARQFRLSSEHAWEANLLVSNRALLNDIQKLCNSSQMFLAMEKRKLQFTEVLIPEEGAFHHVMNCVAAMARIAEDVADMPGIQAEIAVPFLASHRMLLLRAAYVAFPVLLACSIMLFASLRRPVQAAQSPSIIGGIPLSDSEQIPNLQNWRLARQADLDVAGLDWAQHHGQQVNGRIRGAFGEHGDEGYAYLLKKDDPKDGQSSRLVLLVDGKLRFDAAMPKIAIVARVPKGNIESIQWKGRGPGGQPDGDGILIVPSYDDPSSGIVLYSSGVRIMTGNAKDYRTVSLD